MPDSFTFRAWDVQLKVWPSPGTAKCPEPLCPQPALPAAARCRAPCRRALPLVPRSYGLMRQTKFLRPTSVALIRPILAGCCQPLLEDGPSRRYLRSLCQVAWTPTPPRLWRSRSVCASFLFGQDTGSSPERRPRPSLYGLGTRNVPCMATSTGRRISGLQSFANVQASSLARPPGCAYRCVPQGSQAVYVTQ